MAESKNNCVEKPIFDLFTMESNYLALFLGFILTWSYVDCDGRMNIGRKMPADTTPSCAFNEIEGAVVECFYLQAEDMHLLSECLEQSAKIAYGFGVEMYFCNGSAVPVDIFEGYVLWDIVYSSCNLPHIPYELFINMNPEMERWGIEYNTFISTVANAPDQVMPFAETFGSITITGTNIQSIDSGFLTQFPNMKTLYMNDNQLTEIGLELLGLRALMELYYNDNSISAIESGAFQDLGSLLSLGLNNNNFSNLQEEAFQGLENSPIDIIDLGGNPWNCTCELQWLKDWLSERNLVDYSQAQCAYPVVGKFNDVDFC